MTGGEHISQEDLTLHALQALSGEEAAAARHLEQCAECRAALAEATGDLALLALMAEPQPRQRVRASASSNRSALNRVLLRPPPLKPKRRKQRLFISIANRPSAFPSGLLARQPRLGRSSRSAWALRSCACIAVCSKRRHRLIN